MRRLTLALLSGALAVGLVAGPVAAKQPDKSGMNIVDKALQIRDATGEFSTLIALVENLGLVDALSARGQLTVFAPTDQAFFDAFGITAEDVPALVTSATRASLTDVVLYHVAKGNRDAGEVLGSSQIRMLNGDFAMVNASLMPPTIDGAPITGANAAYASNGIIHVVGAVLDPNS